MLKFRSGLTAGELSLTTAFLSLAHFYTTEVPEHLRRSTYGCSELLPPPAPRGTEPKPDTQLRPVAVLSIELENHWLPLTPQSPAIHSY